MGEKIFFTKELLAWNKNDNKREMPWKNEKDPYKIWISEIILQQTRVNQGLEYYNRFIAKYPDVESIATARESEVFKVWEGLGYYTRCRNIIASAKHITHHLDGKFPADYDTILQLKGIGTYTASAISSFAFGLPYSVLDGNVFRVLARYFGIKIPVDTLEGKRFFNSLANELIDKKNPAVYNQAIMDFGATVCKPLPLCEICPLNQKCFAYLNGVISKLPIKVKRIIKKDRWVYYLVIKYKQKFYVRKRVAKDIWQNLYEFILIETSKRSSPDKLKESDSFKSLFVEIEFEITNVSKIYKQILTHQIINGQFLNISVKNPLKKSGYELVTQQQLNELPFPKFITTYLRD